MSFQSYLISEKDTNEGSDKIIPKENIKVSLEKKINQLVTEIVNVIVIQEKSFGGKTLGKQGFLNLSTFYFVNFLLLLDFLQLSSRTLELTRAFGQRSKTMW